MIYPSEERASALEDPTDARVENEATRRQQLILEYRQAATPLLSELQEVGITLDEANGISDLNQNSAYRNKRSYQTALPILLKWLPHITNQRLKEDVVRVLSVAWAKPQAAPALVVEFEKADATSTLGLKWAIGNALAVVADDQVFEKIVALLQAPKHGRAREMLGVALGNMMEPRAVDVLIEALQDDEVAGHAIIGLGKLKNLSARPFIEPFLSHPKRWVRAEARRALARIDSRHHQ